MSENKHTITCKICKSGSNRIFTHKVLNKYDVSYYQCSQCFLIETEQPYWLNEAYQDALNAEDTGILKRNEDFKRKVDVLIKDHFNKESKYLEFAGGYGIFTRMMRDIGYDFYWSDKYAENILSKGFEHQAGNQYEALTAFEVFEHMTDPVSEIKEMLEITDTIIFSTVLVHETAPQTNWWYYGFDHGQHISLYSLKSLETLAASFGLNLYSNKSSFHILTRKNIGKFNFRLSLLKAKFLYPLFKGNLKSKTDSDASLLLKRKQL